jgi:hypothetical protein
VTDLDMFKQYLTVLPGTLARFKVRTLVRQIPLRNPRQCGHRFRGKRPPNPIEGGHRLLIG